MHLLTPTDGDAVGGGLSPHQILALQQIVMGIPQPWPGMPYPGPGIEFA